jgi:uncharacterized phiE125 gp8 family phage protein
VAWAPDYLTISEARAYLRIDDGNDDVEIGAAVTAASRAIDLSANRQFGLVAVAEVRYYTAEWDGFDSGWVIPIDDLMTAPAAGAVVVQDSDGTDIGVIDQYTLRPRNSAAVNRPWTEIVVKPASATTPTGASEEIAITARWGWTSVPPEVKQACCLQASRFFARRDSPYGVAGSPDVGSEMRLLARLDPDVLMAIGPLRRWWSAK